MAKRKQPDIYIKNDFFRKAWSVILLLEGASVFCVLFVDSGVSAGAVTGSLKCAQDGCVPLNNST